MADFRDFWVSLEITLRPRSAGVLYRDGFSRRSRFRISGEPPPRFVPTELIGLIRELASRLPSGRPLPHDTGPVPLPIFLHVPDFIPFGWEPFLASALAADIDLDRIQFVRLTRESRRRRTRFRLPFRILTVGAPDIFGLDRISTATWFAESPDIQEFGINIEAALEPGEALRQIPRDILVAPGPVSSDPLYDLLSSLPISLRPRLLINCSYPVRRVPEGVSVLHVPGLDPSRRIVPEIVYGLIHDMPLHEAVKSAERRTGSRDMTLLTNPAANHDLRISDSLLELRRDALRLSSAFAQPAPAKERAVGVQNVVANWSIYASLMKAMFMAINEPQRLANATPVIGPFPADRPGEWGTWLNAYAFLGALGDAVRVTDAALRQENALVAAANEIAAKVQLSAPSRADIESLVDQLHVVNSRIQQDQRFAAVLAIGVALVGQLEGQLNEARAAGPSKVYNILDRNAEALGRIRLGVDRIYSYGADFSQEARGLTPLVRAESSMNDVRLAAERLGSEFAELLADEESRNQLAAEQRRTIDLALERLDTDAFLSPVESNRTLQAGARYQLRVHIGNRLPGSLVQGNVPPIDPLLPGQADGHKLDVTVQRKEFALLSDVIQATFLPRLGASEPVYFAIRAPITPGPATLRVCFYYRNHLLQSLLLTTEVTPSEEVRASNTTHAALEFSRTERFANLDELQPRAVSIGANRGMGDTHEIFIKGTTAGTVPLGDKAFTDAMDDVRAILLAATVDPSDNLTPRLYPPVPPGEAAAPEVASVIRQLAEKGQELYAALFQSARSSRTLLASLAGLRDTSSETVQVVRFYERFVFPWALLYDFELPDTGRGEVCLGYARGPNVAPQPCGHRSLDKVYCVHGFWGARHRVEELIAGGPTGDAVKTIRRPQGAEPIRMAIDDAVPGADNLHKILMRELGDALALGPMESQDLIGLLWAKPPKRPAVLLILGHLETGTPQLPNEPKGERIVLEPERSWLSQQSISAQFNRAAEVWDQPRPLVLLMACGSATTNVAKVNDFVLALNAAGAGAIVGTECTVFSDFACEFSQYLILQLWKSPSANRPVSLGEAMTAFRIEKLESGDPRAFVFRSIGDAELTLQH